MPGAARLFILSGNFSGIIYRLPCPGVRFVWAKMQLFFLQKNLKIKSQLFNFKLFNKP